MKKLFGVSIIIILAISFCFVNAFADPSSKLTANVGEIMVVPGDGQFHTIMENTIKTASAKDLIADVSLESVLYTDTKVVSKLLQKSDVKAEATITVRVLLDGNPMLPGEVTFARRSQQMIASFAGDISGCLVADPNTGIVSILDPNCVLPEELELILDTTSANSFNFIAADVGVGSHTVSVQALVETDTEIDSVDDAFAGVNAAIENGSVTIEEVRMIKGEDLEPEI